MKKSKKLLWVLAGIALIYLACALGQLIPLSENATRGDVETTLLHIESLFLYLIGPPLSWFVATVLVCTFHTERKGHSQNWFEASVLGIMPVMILGWSFLNFGAFINTIVTAIMLPIVICVMTVLILRANRLLPLIPEDSSAK